MRGLLKEMIETQMFVYLIQQRQDSPSPSHLFYDQAVQVFNTLSLSALVGDTRNYYPVSLLRNCDLSRVSDALLCELVECVNSLVSVFTPSRRPILEEVLTAIRKRNMMSVVQKGSFLTSNGVDLFLEDSLHGPLVIPGPCRVEVSLQSAMHDDALRQGTRYYYDHGWPLLSHDLLHPTFPGSDGGIQQIRQHALHANLVRTYILYQMLLFILRLVRLIYEVVC